MSHITTEKNALEIVKRNLDDDEIFFATSIDEEEIIRHAVSTAMPNYNPNSFPDFIFDDGFIEHFAITSSKEDRKGSRMKKEESGFNRDFAEKEEKFKEFMNDNPSFDEVKTISQDYHYTEHHSHENLTKSLVNNLESHIRSSSKYGGKNKTKIYLIEYDEFNLHMYISYKEIKSERHYGDLLYREDDTLYRLSRDKEMLKTLYLYKNDVDFILFKTCNRIEIINVKEIPEILKLIKYDYDFSEVVAYKVMSTHCISVKNESGDKNE